MLINFNIHIVVYTWGSNAWCTKIELWFLASSPTSTITPHYNDLPT